MLFLDIQIICEDTKFTHQPTVHQLLMKLPAEILGFL